MSLLFICRPLVVNPALAVRLGLNEAILLQQVHYWLTDTAAGIEYDGKRWIYNTLEGWHEQFPFMSLSTIKRGFASLKKQGVLRIEQLSDDKHNKTNYYSIDYAARAITDEVKLTPSNGSDCTNGTGQIEPMEQVNLDRSMGSNWPDVTETTTEITTETTQENKTTREVDCPPVDNFSESDDLDADKTGLTVAEDFGLARWFWSTILELYERAAEFDGSLAKPQEPNWAIWANEIRLLRAAHGCTHEQVRAMVQKIQANQFWCPKIQTPRVLRDKWPELALKLCSGNLSTRYDPFGVSSKIDTEIPPGFRGSKR